MSFLSLGASWTYLNSEPGKSYKLPFFSLLFYTVPPGHTGGLEGRSYFQSFMAEHMMVPKALAFMVLESTCG
jgi:hypothetical protein